MIIMLKRGVQNRYNYEHICACVRMSACEYPTCWIVREVHSSKEMIVGAPNGTYHTKICVVPTVTTMISTVIVSQRVMVHRQDRI